MGSGSDSFGDIFNDSSGKKLVEFFRKKQGNFRVGTNELFKLPDLEQVSFSIPYEKVNSVGLSSDPNNKGSDDVASQATSSRKIRSGSLARRMLLEKLDKTVDSPFLPPTCSTPLTSRNCGETETSKHLTPSVVLTPKEKRTTPFAKKQYVFTDSIITILDDSSDDVENLNEDRPIAIKEERNTSLSVNCHKTIDHDNCNDENYILESPEISNLTLTANSRSPRRTYTIVRQSDVGNSEQLLLKIENEEETEETENLRTSTNTQKNCTSRSIVQVNFLPVSRPQNAENAEKTSIISVTRKNNSKSTKEGINERNEFNNDSENICMEIQSDKNYIENNLDKVAECSRFLRDQRNNSSRRNKDKVNVDSSFPNKIIRLSIPSSPQNRALISRENRCLETRSPRNNIETNPDEVAECSPNLRNQSNNTSLRKDSPSPINVNIDSNVQNKNRRLSVSRSPQNRGTVSSENSCLETRFPRNNIESNPDEVADCSRTLRNQIKNTSRRKDSPSPINVNVDSNVQNKNRRLSISRSPQNRGTVSRENRCLETRSPRNNIESDPEEVAECSRTLRNQSKNTSRRKDSPSSIHVNVDSNVQNKNRRLSISRSPQNRGTVSRENRCLGTRSPRNNIESDPDEVAECSRTLRNQSKNTSRRKDSPSSIHVNVDSNVQNKNRRLSISRSAQNRGTVSSENRCLETRSPRNNIESDPDEVAECSRTLRNQSKNTSRRKDSPSPINVNVDSNVQNKNRRLSISRSAQNRGTVSSENSCLETRSPRNNIESDPDEVAECSRTLRNQSKNTSRRKGPPSPINVNVDSNVQNKNRRLSISRSAQNRGTVSSENRCLETRSPRNNIESDPDVAADCSRILRNQQKNSFQRMATASLINGRVDRSILEEKSGNVASQSSPNSKRLSRDYDDDDFVRSHDFNFQQSPSRCPEHNSNFSGVSTEKPRKNHRANVQRRATESSIMQYSRSSSSSGNSVTTEIFSLTQNKITEENKCQTESASSNLTMRHRKSLQIDKLQSQPTQSQTTSAEAKKMRLEVDANSEVPESMEPSDFPSHPETYENQILSRLRRLSQSVLSGVPPSPISPRQSSLIDDDSGDRITFSQKSVSNLNSKGTDGRKRKKTKKMQKVPELLSKYLEVSANHISKQSPNKAKRKLYSKELLDESPNKSSESNITELQPNQPLSEVNEGNVASHLQTTQEANISPKQPVDSSSVKTPLPSARKKESKESEVFKKPLIPKKQNVKKKPKSNKITSGSATKKSKENASGNETIEVESTTEPRRSKRGHKPLKNYWSCTETEYIPLWDWRILEKAKQAKAKKKEDDSQTGKKSNNKKSAMQKKPTAPTFSSKDLNIDNSRSIVSQSSDHITQSSVSSRYQMRNVRVRLSRTNVSNVDDNTTVRTVEQVNHHHTDSGNYTTEQITESINPQTNYPGEENQFCYSIETPKNLRTNEDIDISLQWIKHLLTVTSSSNGSSSIQNLVSSLHFQCASSSDIIISTLEGIEYISFKKKQLKVSLIRFPANAEKSRSRTAKYQLNYFLLAGQLEFNVLDEKAILSGGDLITIDKEKSYSVRNLSDTRMALAYVTKQ